MATVKKTIYGALVLAPGKSVTYWHTWGFTDKHWVDIDACPTSDNSHVEVTRQYARKDINGTVLRYATFKNIGSTTVRFNRPCVKII